MLRLLTPLAKLFTAKEAVAVVSEGEGSWGHTRAMWHPVLSSSSTAVSFQPARFSGQLHHACQLFLQAVTPLLLLLPATSQALSSLGGRATLRAPTCPSS